MASSLSVSFRKAKRTDIPAIAKIFDTALNETKEFDDIPGYLRDSLKDPDDRLIVATDKTGKVAGFIMTDFKSDTPKAVNIDQLAVDENFRHQGIGSALMKKAEEIALKNKFRSVTLQVRADNDNAKHLYEEQGFRQIGKHRWYYGDGTTAFEMKKPLVPGEAAEPKHWVPKFIRKLVGLSN